MPGFTVFADNFNVFVPTKSDDWEAERKDLNRSVEKICCFCNHKARIGKQRFKDLIHWSRKLMFFVSIN
jgi:hypothetical protein